VTFQPDFGLRVVVIGCRVLVWNVGFEIWGELTVEGYIFGQKCKQQVSCIGLNATSITIDVTRRRTLGK
jgi:hypothetical protein